MTKLEKTIYGLECCLNTGNFEECIENCPYFSKKFGVGVCSENMMRDALALLKAQNPRIMTREELSALPIDTPVFIEEINGECGWNVFYGIDEEKDVCFCGFRASADYYNLEEYGESWRCWTSRPTDEQREAVKWE